MIQVAFVVPGTPVGKGRPKFARRGAYVTAYTPQKTASYENLVRMAAAEAMAGRPPITGPVAMVLLIEVTPPASWSAKKQAQALRGDIRPTTKPDVDNVLKGICDACNEVVFKDDKQIVAVTIHKSYAPTARAGVTVAAL